VASRRLVIFEGNVAPLDDTIGEQHQQIVLLEVDVSLPEATRHVDAQRRLHDIRHGNDRTAPEQERHGVTKTHDGQPPLRASLDDADEAPALARLR
jgi:hypothetical protein